LKIYAKFVGRKAVKSLARSGMTSLKESPWTLAL